MTPDHDTLPRPVLLKLYRTLQSVLRRITGRPVLSVYQTLARLIELRSRRRVMSGPFQGMLYPKEVTGNAMSAKLLGIYEKELHGAVAQLKACRIASVINVGAAEGYYAVGLARMLNPKMVFAFEQGDEARTNAALLARANGVESKITADGYCDAERLRGTLAECEYPALVFADVEGGEINLLDPREIPALCRAFILVETHDFLGLDTTTPLLSRFKASHEILRIPTVVRSGADVPLWLPSFLTASLLEVASDQRPCFQEWFFMRPRDG